MISTHHTLPQFNSELTISRTKNHVTPNSAEAELIASIKNTSEMPGVRAMLRYWGMQKSGIMYADSSSTLAIAKRNGAGKLRHISTSALWLQENRIERIPFMPTY